MFNVIGRAMEEKEEGQNNSNNKGKKKMKKKEEEGKEEKEEEKEKHKMWSKQNLIDSHRRLFTEFSQIRFRTSLHDHLWHLHKDSCLYIQSYGMLSIKEIQYSEDLARCLLPFYSE